MRVDINKDYKFADNQYLWKYMDLHRLIYFLHSQNIFFSPLSNFFDPLEGITEEHLQDKVFADSLDKKSQEQEGLPKKSREKLKEEKHEINQRFKSRLEEIQKTYFASCWYIGIRESLAMWDTYSNKDSVALKFKPGQLCNSILDSCKKLDNTDFDLMVHGKVEYYQISPFDESDECLKNADHKFTGFIKDLSYKHEEEFRFLVKQSNQNATYDFFELSLDNLAQMDFEVVTHPYMEPWKYSNIYNILKNEGLQDNLTKSLIPTRRQVFDTP